MDLILMMEVGIEIGTHWTHVNQATIGAAPDGCYEVK
jgi:hypothetical protein